MSWTTARPAYPGARRDDDRDVLHGRTVPDPYRWLEDAGSPDTVAWSRAQRELFEAAAAGLPGREALAGRLRDLLSAGSVGTPVWRGRRRFVVRRRGDQEHGVLVVLDDPADDPVTGGRVLVDPMALDPAGLTTLDSWNPCRDGSLLAYQVSEGGTEESVLRVMDVATGADVDGPIDRARYSPVAWLPDASGFYYVRRQPPGTVPAGEEQYHRRVRLHPLGGDPEDDAEVFGAGHDLRSYFGVGLSRDGRWLMVSAATGTAPRNDLWIADLGTPDAPGAAAVCRSPTLRPVATGLDAQTYGGVSRDGRLYLETDLDAPRGRLVVADPLDPGPAGWRDLLPEDGEAVLEDHLVLDGPALERPLLLASWTRHAVSEVTVHDLATGERLPGDAGTVPLPGLGSVGGLVGHPEGGHETWFTYTDHTTLPRVLHWDARTGGAPRLHAGPPGDVAVPDVSSRQVAYRSADGTTVRMFVLCRTDLLGPGGVPRTPLPAILYGYGGFAVPLTPGYSATVLAWVEAGGVYAVANLRGGSEEGEAWHRAGMLGSKQNVFDDFHAAGEHLVATGWTSPDRLAASGGSNGGLLVGAALTQRPDLFAAVVCSAPLLDMVRYERFGLGATWNVEYGSAEDPEQLGWLLDYSPYHRVVPGTGYPAVLFTVFDGDSRVDPLHARKMCAALQHATAGDRPVLLRAEGDVGHGARALSRSVALAADTLSFTARWTGLEIPEGTAPHP